jgi:uncharacterized membrane protein
MATEGQGSARIILVGRNAGVRPEAEVAVPPVRAEPDRVAAPVPNGWTVRRLINAGSLAGVATVAGGLVFQKNFQLFGDSNRQLLAIGFGLFVVGMIVLTLCLIGLAAAAIRALVAGQGLAAAILLMLAPAVPLVLLNAIGLISFAFPALFVIIVAGGFTLALRR